jgi:hypothetical protein
MLCRQALYHLSLTSIPLCFGLFFTEVLKFLPMLGLDDAGSSYLCLPHSWNYRSKPPYPVWFFCSDDFFLNLSLGWPQTVILPISASRVAGITDVSYHEQPRMYIFFPMLHFSFPNLCKCVPRRNNFK